MKTLHKFARSNMKHQRNIVLHRGLLWARPPHLQGMGMSFVFYLQCRRPWFDSWVRKILWRRGRLPTPVFLGFPFGSTGKEPACKKKKKRICLQWGRPGFSSWFGKIPCRRERLPTPVFWPGKFHGLYSPWGHIESETSERLSLSLSTMIEDSLLVDPSFFLTKSSNAATKVPACHN